MRTGFKSSLRASIERDDHARFCALLGFLADLESAGLLEPDYSRGLFEQHFEDLSTRIALLSLHEILEDRSASLSAVQKNIVAGLLKETKKKVVARTRLLDGPNIAAFLGLALQRFRLETDRLAGLIGALPAGLQQKLDPMLRSVHSATLFQIAFSFSEDNLLKLGCPEFIRLEVFMLGYPKPSEDRAAFVENWSARSRKYFARHALNTFRETLHAVAAPSLALGLVDRRLAHELGLESLADPWAAQLLAEAAAFTDRVNRVLMSSAMSEGAVKFVQQVHRLGCFSLYLGAVGRRLGEGLCAEATQAAFAKVASLLRLLLAWALKLCAKAGFEACFPQHVLGLFAEEPEEAERRNAWDRCGVLSMASTRSRHREFKQLLEALRRAAGSAECDAEAVNFLKLGGAMRPEEPFDKIQNRFAKLEALVLTFLNSKRLTELCSALVDCRLLDPAQQALVCGVSRSTRSCLAARIVEEKLSLEGFVMCMVNRKFDEKQPKEYFSLLEAVLKDLEAKCSYMLRGALSQGDAEDLLAELRVAALRFALEVLQDMLTKVGFSNEGFERVQNDYPHIKRHLRLRESDDTRSEDLLHSRVCELKELIGDKNKLLAHICANCLLLSNLLMRKLSEKHLANSDLDQVKEAARKSIALLANN